LVADRRALQAFLAAAASLVPPGTEGEPNSSTIHTSTPRGILRTRANGATQSRSVTNYCSDQAAVARLGLIADLLSKPTRIGYMTGWP
jgi:hypothetical protein